MNILSVDNVNKRIGEIILFDGLTFGLSQGQKAALVGVNGSGKSTLLKIIAGIETADTGVVSVRNGIRIGYLAQDPEFDATLTLLQHVYTSPNPVIETLNAYNLLLQKPSSTNEYEEKLVHLTSLIEHYNAWDYESTIISTLSILGLPNPETLISSLSGGQKKRLALAEVILQQPDFLILDEPTNHLDLNAIEWLEQMLKNQKQTLLMITHDRYFLDNVTNEILELANFRLHTYNGNFGYYLEKKHERETQMQAETDKAKNLYRRELEWMRSTPQARSTKAKARIDSFYSIEEKAKRNLTQQQVELNVKTTRLGGKILELKSLSKKYGDKTILKQLTYTFRKNEKVGIVGQNGAGKSTFLKLILGEVNPDSGSIVTGETVKFGYFSQDGLVFNEGQRVLEVVKDIAEVIEVTGGHKITASQLLQKFLFEPARQHTVISKLSGGEKRRLHLCQILMSNPNFLILDEPTNDLDILTLSILEDFLVAFQGCLMVVSHDRYFLDKMVDHVLVFEGEGEIKDFPGNYTDYRNSSLFKKPKTRDKQDLETKTVAKEVAKSLPKTEGKKLSFKEQREFDTLEKEIAALEVSKNVLINKLNSGESDHLQLQTWASDIAVIDNKIENKTLRWMEIGEKAM